MHKNETLELSIKSIIVGCIIALALCGANMYLGLKIGTTIAASIPASIISLGIFRLFKKYSILENNIAQTIASSGEGIATVVIFVVPALLILGTWHEFHYFEIFIFGLSGGVIGIIYSIILRKVLLGDKDLKFPEGQAIGQVLIATNNSKDKTVIKTIAFGIIFSAIVNFLQNGLKLIADGYNKFFNFSAKSAGGLGLGFSPAVISAGFIIGSGTFVAGITVIVAWTVLIPYLMQLHNTYNPSNISASVYTTWSTYVRPMGIGVFVLGGLYTSVTLFKSIIHAVSDSIIAIKNISTGNIDKQDLDFRKLFILLVVCLIPICYFIFHQISMISQFNTILTLLLSVLVCIFVAVIGFIIASVAGYIVGLVGSSNSPLSGLYFIATILLSLIFKFICGELNVSNHLNILFSSIVLIVSFIGYSACITNENIQDYKSGEMVGATPYKQQIALFFGVIVSIIAAPLLINLIFNAYGIGGVVPHAGINPNDTLAAPQANAVASIVKNVLNNTQDWSGIIIGMIIGVVAIIVDTIGKKTAKFRTPSFMVAFGLYMPPSIVFTLLLGGLINYLIKLRHKKLAKTEPESKILELENKANILACGLIAGESIMGVVLAIPFVIKQSSDALRIVPDSITSGAVGTSVGAIISAYTLYILYKFGTKLKK